MSSVPEKHIRIRPEAGVAIVDFTNADIVYASDVVQELGEELLRLLTDHHYSRILLNFSNVQYLSSTMLAQLAKLEREVGKVKGQLKMCGLGPILRDTIRIGHFERIFDIQPDEASALQSFRPE
jgi:anti-sigma B factor antagonist